MTINQKPFAFVRLLLPVAIMLCAQNGARVWLFLSEHVEGQWIVLAVSVVFASGLGVWAYKSSLNFHSLFSSQMILLVGVLAFLFWLPDDRFIVKKLHIPEYIAIALACYWALQPFINSAYAQRYASLIFAMFLGLHDEVMQGFHPERYFGYLDVIVNAGSAITGIWLIRLLYEGAEQGSFIKDIRVLWSAIFVSLIGVVLFIYLCWSYKGGLLPVWGALPVVLACGPYFILRSSKAMSVDVKFVRNLLVFMIFSLSLYVSGGYILSLNFD
ncbi:MAG: VanZ family protein [Terasakiella sp.]|uniref:VanZ family protein n=1 Tax=unclassified Terasakiella TaxID=2614952 RepID=UPI003AFF873F